MELALSDDPRDYGTGVQPYAKLDVHAPVRVDLFDRRDHIERDVRHIGRVRGPWMGDAGGRDVVVADSPDFSAPYVWAM